MILWSFGFSSYFLNFGAKYTNVEELSIRFFSEETSIQSSWSNPFFPNHPCRNYPELIKWFMLVNGLGQIAQARCVTTFDHFLTFLPRRRLAAYFRAVSMRYWCIGTAVRSRCVAMLSSLLFHLKF